MKNRTIRISTLQAKLCQAANSLEKRLDFISAKNKRRAERIIKDLRRMADVLDLEQVEKLEKQLSGVRVKTLPTGRTRILLKQR